METTILPTLPHSFKSILLTLKVVSGLPWLVWKEWILSPYGRGRVASISGFAEKTFEDCVDFRKRVVEGVRIWPRLVLQRQLHVVLPVELHLVKKLNFNIHDTTLHETLRTTLLRQNTWKDYSDISSKWGRETSFLIGHSFSYLFSVYFKQKYNIFNKLMWKIVYPVYVAGIINHNPNHQTRTPTLWEIS